MNTLVTGGGGFLGGAIAVRLRQEGHTVRSFSRGDYPWLAQLGIEQVRGDLADRKAVMDACRDCEIVYHVAAKAGIWGRDEDFRITNVVGTGNILRACRHLGIRRLVYTSSPSVVFDGRDMENADESVPYPETFKAAYPQTKAVAEQLILTANDSELATVALRPHLIWGPDDPHLVPAFIERGRKGGFKRLGKVNKLVDFTFIANAAEAHLQAGCCLDPGARHSGHAYFISQGEPWPLWDFINKVLELAGLPPVEKTVSPRLAYGAGAFLEALYRFLPLKGEPRMTRFLAEELSTAHWFSIDAARRDFGYEPIVSMEAGFGQLREWIKSRWPQRTDAG